MSTSKAARSDAPNFPPFKPFMRISLADLDDPDKARAGRLALFTWIALVVTLVLNFGGSIAGAVVYSSMGVKAAFVGLAILYMVLFPFVYFVTVFYAAYGSLRWGTSIRYFLFFVSYIATIIVLIICIIGVPNIGLTGVVSVIMCFAAPHAIVGKIIAAVYQLVVLVAWVVCLLGVIATLLQTYRRGFAKDHGNLVKMKDDLVSKLKRKGAKAAISTAV